MKQTLRRFAILAGIASALCSSAFAEETRSGFLSHYDQLRPGPEGGVKMRYIKPGVDLKRYTKIMLDSVVFFLDEKSYKGIDPQELKELGDTFNAAMVKAIGDLLPIVSDPGPDVIRVKAAVTGLKQNKPGQSVISSLVPIGIGISVLKKGTTGSWSGSGTTAMEFEAVDSLTNTVLVAAMDERSAGYLDRFSKWGSAKEAFEFWAERAKKFIEEAWASK